MNAFPPPSQEKPSILVIDDSTENLDVLKETLKGSYIVRPALHGELGLRIANSKPQPDLILLDVMMPGIDGYEVLRQLRTDPATKDIPVIFVTAVSDVVGELRGLELGAVDYITKPFNPSVVRARVRTHLALRAAQKEIERQNSELVYERELIERTIERMRESDQFDTAYLRYVVAPLERSNGDILLSARTADGGQWLLFGDTTGHGLPAAVAAPLISYIFYSHARAGHSAATTISEINAMMCQQLPAELFMTACFVDIAADRKSFSAWNAAMPPMVLFSGGEVRQRIEASRLMPFGISPMLDIEANRVRVTLDHPSRLYLHSDGASDVEDADGKAFGSYRLELFIAEMLKYDMTPADLLPHLAAFNGNQVFEDDIGLIEIAL